MELVVHFRPVPIDIADIALEDKVATSEPFMPRASRESLLVAGCEFQTLTPNGVRLLLIRRRCQAFSKLHRQSFGTSGEHER
jgi:hypothetical protein